jgi:integrase
MTPHLAIAPDPDQSLFAQLGVPDSDTGRLLHVAFSNLLGDARGQRTFTYPTCRALAGIGRLEFRRSDGTLDTAPAPELDPFGWPDRGTAFNRLQLTATELDREWDRVRALDGLHATLPLEIVCEFFPARLWPLCAQLLSWGPAETCERLERFARLEALREIKPTRARPEGGTLSAASVDALLKAGRRFLNVLCQLQQRGYPSPALEHWSALPSRIEARNLGAVEVHTDRTAPPLLLVRRTLKGLTAEIDRRSQLRRGSGLMRLLRKRLLLALLAVTGMRIGALWAISPRDYDPAHRFPDGEIGPALRIYPGKTLASGDGRWKALPAEVAAWLEHYLDYVDIDRHSEGPFWPSDHKWGRAMHPKSLFAVVAGDQTGTVRPLLPREETPEYGYSPHTLRHLAEQLAYEVGHDYLGEHSEARAFITPQVLSEALLDHELSSDHLGYKDLDTPEGRERWARVAGLGLWEYLWGRQGRAPGARSRTN